MNKSPTAAIVFWQLAPAEILTVYEQLQKPYQEFIAVYVQIDRAMG